MIEAGDAASAGPLARRAVERVTAALMYMDDSAGIVGDDLRSLMAMYARACRPAPPDAGRLAAWLVSMQLDGPGWPAIELKEFAEALGQDGLAEVARLTEERGVTAEPDSWTAVWAAAMANPGQVPESQWFQLIEVREQNHPGDVIRPYQDLIEIGLERASDKYRYPKAIKTIRRLRDSYQPRRRRGRFHRLRCRPAATAPP